ncbi:hypothetical protein [Cytobacillus firmus]|uniref:Uncharacterized protein n=1 Tax=Cytobacillus firmus TaxID=1399 RepID=A0AA46PCI2_CYTFI|nr:hypothetical protein [Cytobacillus firmus]UYG95343.1 hypothetical protein OD459_24730 [Cytobacillus firmus]
MLVITKTLLKNVGAGDLQNLGQELLSNFRYFQTLLNNLMKQEFIREKPFSIEKGFLNV